MRTEHAGNRGKPVSLGMAILGILALSIFLINSEDVYASKLQTQSPATIFAASCATCHGSAGLGGVTFVKDNPGDNRIAPKVAGLDVKTIKSRVRSGTLSNSMPAFGKEEITDAELSALATWINSNPSGVPAPTAPGGSGDEVRVDILDADPWFSDSNNANPVRDSDLSDIRRIELTSPAAYLKIYNTGRTWHTFTNGRLSPKKDSGFIGYAGNFKTAPNDLGDMGYYYADQSSGLAPGCNNYYCKMHPYMQVEVCTSGSPNAALTRASKDPIGTPPAGGATEEVWVVTQSQEEAGEDTTTVANKSVTGMDGTYQVINAGTWGVTYIPQIGNNPHNAWPGKDGVNDVVLSASWHDNTVSLMDASAKTLIKEKRSGAGNAHVMVTPGSAERFYVTHMGGSALQEIDVAKLRLGQDPNVSTGRTSGAGGPHGLWMCDPIGGYNYVLTADTFSNTATLFNTNLKRRVSADSGGTAPLAPSIMSGFGNGCQRGFTNNALTTDVSIYEINANPGQETIAHVTFNQNIDVAAPGVDYNGAGNIALKDTTATGCTPVAVGNGFKCTDPVRWAALPIQTPVSPGDSQHPQYVVTANKASFNVSVTRLSPTTGMPVAHYTFPSGLGAHGVTYGRKGTCTKTWGDDGNPNNAGTLDSDCYYAYVTNTFEGGENSIGTAGYISVFDLEMIDTTSMGAPGSAFSLTAAINLDGLGNNVGGCDPGDFAAGNCYEDPTTFPLGNGDGVCDPGEDIAGACVEIMFVVTPAIGGETVYAEGGGAGAVIADLAANGPDMGAIGGGCVLNINAPGGPGNGTADIVEIAICVGLTNGGDMDLDGVGPDLRAPITAFCPDCRSGVHVGDVPLDDAPGLISDSTEYTYVKEDVWVDDVNSLVVTSTGPVLPGATIGLGGTVNAALILDLDLQTSTGGQGIMVRDSATGSAPAAPWP